jgi:hypothetical protein
MPSEGNYPFLFSELAVEESKGVALPGGERQRRLEKGAESASTPPLQGKAAGWNGAAKKESSLEPAVEGPLGVKKRPHREVIPFTGCGKKFLSLSHSTSRPGRGRSRGGGRA